MAERTSAEEAPEGLSCQTWVLKVSMHCLGCKRKVQKVLQGIDGVYTTSIDSQQHRVTVTGNVEVQTLIKKLRKTGKQAEIWPEKVGTREKGTVDKNNYKPKDPNGGHSNEKGSKSIIGLNGNNPTEEAKNGRAPPEKSTTGEKFTAVDNKGTEGACIGGGKKKKKVENCDKGYSSCSAKPAGSGYLNQNLDGMDHAADPTNVTPTRQHYIPCPQDFYIPQVIASSYNMAHLSENHVPLCYVQPSLYTHANGHQVSPLDSLNIFSDENVNGCSIM